MIGHPQGASGAAGVVATALALANGFLPPTINLDDPDPACDMDFIPNEGRAVQAGSRALQLPRVRLEELRPRAGGRGRQIMTPPDDVVIAGAGPAGTLAACLLARRGARVTLIDRSRFPREKLCGDTLNPGALALLSRHFDLAPLRRQGCVIDGMLLTGPGGVCVRGEYGAGMQGLGITRDRLDAWMVEQAVAAGARLVDETTVVAPEQESDGTRTRGAGPPALGNHERLRRAHHAGSGRPPFAAGTDVRADAHAARILAAGPSAPTSTRLTGSRRSARCTSATATTSAWHPRATARANACLVAAARIRSRRMA